MYPALEANEAALEGEMKQEKAKAAFKAPKDEERRPRGADEMAKEAEWLAGYFQ